MGQQAGARGCQGCSRGFPSRGGCSPRPLWLAVVGFTSWGVVWTVLVPCAVVAAGLGLGSFVRSFRAPDRHPFELSPDWISIFAITGSLLFFGGVTVLDDDPRTNTAIAWVLLAVGAVLVGLCIHHFTKPVRDHDADRRA